MMRTSGAAVVWVEPHRLQAGSQVRRPGGLPDPDTLAQALSGLPGGPSHWIVDDLCAPAVLLRDVLGLPKGVEARDAFFQWRYAQSLGLEGPQSVQALAVDSDWLLAGLPRELLDGWLQVATKLNRPVQSMVPRWLWLYNRLAPSQTGPGLLLSLDSSPDGNHTGSLVAWGSRLSLLRQWGDPAPLGIWITERILPTLAYLQREGTLPQGLWVWCGSTPDPATWSEVPVPIHVMPPDVPATEAL
nr:hypothetical protein [uncultured Holophaga sp.]